MKKLLVALLIGTFPGCATVQKPQIAKSPAVSELEQLKAQAVATAPKAPRLKRKIAVLRFSNETNYGRSLMTDKEYDQVGKQASDMLVSKLIESQEFLVFERSDLAKLQKERSAKKHGELIGVDTVISGSVTEFGRSVEGQSGFLSGTKLQLAHAKVEARLIDVETGHAFFSAKGIGKATSESGTVMGFGSQSEYNGTLNDRAINTAITDLISNLIEKLRQKPWQADLLEVQGSQLFISGGPTQGLKVGDTLALMQQGKSVTSPQSGFKITLPPRRVAIIRITGFFGTNETDEGAICALVSGSIDTKQRASLYVAENRDNE